MLYLTNPVVICTHTPLHLPPADKSLVCILIHEVAAFGFFFFFFPHFLSLFNNFFNWADAPQALKASSGSIIIIIIIVIVIIFLICTISGLFCLRPFSLLVDTHWMPWFTA